MKHLFTFRQRPNESLTGKLARVSSDTLSQVSNKCRPTVGRLSTLFLLLFALSFGFSSQAWADHTFSAGFTLYYDFTAISGGANYWVPGKNMGDTYDANAGGKIIPVTMTASTTMNTSWELAKTQTGGWGVAKYPSDPSDGQNCLKISADGKSFTWTTYTFIPTDVLNGDKIMVYGGELKDWNQSKYYFMTSNSTSSAVETASLDLEVFIDGSSYKFGPVTLPNNSTKYYQGHWNSGLQGAVSAGGAYVVRGSSSSTAYLSQIAYSGSNYLYSVIKTSSTPTKTATTTLSTSTVTYGSTVGVTTSTSAGVSVLGKTNTIQYYLHDGSDWSKITLSNGQADVSGLAVGTGYKIATVLYDGYIYVKADVDEFAVTNPEYTGLTISDSPSGYVSSASTLSVNHVAQGSSVTINKGTSKSGYEFDKITVSGGTLDGTTWTPSANSQSVTVKWKAKTNTVYTVKHYKQNLDGSYPSEPFATDNLTGTTGASVTPAVKTGSDITGFTAPSTQTATIKGDGSLVITYKYTRNSHSLTWNADGGTITGTYTSGTVQYGASITAPASSNVKKAGFNFMGWMVNSSVVTPATTMPDNDLTYTAKWESASTYSLTVVAGTGITSVSGEKTGQTTLPFSSNISATVKQGYSFSTWSKTAGEGSVTFAPDATTASTTATVTGGGSVTLTASATPNTNTAYKVKHYKQNLAGTGYDLAETDNLTGTTDAQVTPAVKSYDGFTAPGTQTVTINGDGTTVVEYQYARKSYNISYTAQATGWTYGAQPASAKYDANVEFVVNPATGYNVTVTSGDVTLTTASAPTYSFTMPAKNVAISVNATVKTWNVTAVANPAAGGQVSGSATGVSQIDGCPVTATPNLGYYFTGWTSSNGSFTDASAKNTTFFPTATTTATAGFAAYATTLTATTGIKEGQTETITPALDEHYPNTYKLCYELWQDDVKLDEQPKFTITSSGVATFTAPQAGQYTVKAFIHEGESCDPQTIIDQAFVNITIAAELNTGWYLIGSYNDWSTSSNLREFVRPSAETAYGEITFENVSMSSDDKTFDAFKMYKGGGYYGHNDGGTMTHEDCTNWIFDVTTGGSANTTLTRTVAGSYTLRFNPTTKALTVIYPTTYAITVNKDANIKSVTGSEPYAIPNQTYPISAQVNDGYAFDGWQVTGEGASVDDATAPSTYATVTTADATFTATATAISYNVIVPQTQVNYTITNLSATTATVGQTVTFTVTPATGYDVTVSMNGTPLSGTNNVYSFTMPAEDVTVTVEASLHDYEITMAVSPANSGTTTPAVGTFTKHYYEVFDISATPAEGYRFVNWTSTSNINLGVGDLSGAYAPARKLANDVELQTSSSQPNTKAQLVDVNGTKTITANFAAEVYTVTLDANGGTAGTTTQVTATYNADMPTIEQAALPTWGGHEFLGYYDDETAGTQYYTSTGASARTWNKTNDVTLYAHWQEVHYYIEGRFGVRSTPDGEIDKFVNDAAGNWKTDSKNIELLYNETAHAYQLNTYCSVSELSQKLGTEKQYFHIAEVKGNSESFTQYALTANYTFKSTQTSTTLIEGKDQNVYFDDTEDNSKPVVLTYDPTTKTLSYTATALQFTVNFGLCDGQSATEGAITATVGGVGIETGNQYSENTVIAFTAAPQAGYTIQGWYSDAACTKVIADFGVESTHSVTLKTDTSVYVKFTPLTVYFINTEKWAKVYAYNYTGDAKHSGEWPGAAMTQDGTVIIQGRTFDVYKYNVVAGSTIIFNNGEASSSDAKKQTANLTVDGNYGKYFMADECFEAGTDPSVKPDGTWYNSLADAQAHGLDCTTDVLVIFNKANEFGTITATKQIGEAEPVAITSGALVDKEAKLVFKATPNSGYSVEGFYWNIECPDSTRYTGAMGSTLTISNVENDTYVYSRFEQYFDVEIGVADGQSEMGTTQPVNTIRQVGAFSVRTAEAISSDPQRYSFDHWSLTINEVEKTDWDGTNYGVTLHDTCTIYYPLIRINATVADAKLIANFKARDVVTLYFVNSDNWEDVHVHLWGGTAEGTTWPGIEPELYDQKVNGHDVYYVTFDNGAYTQYIWNCGNNCSQTVTLNVDKNNPVYNRADNKLYPSLDAVLPDPYTNEEWKLMFNNGGVKLDILNYDNSHIWYCDVEANSKDQNWVKMQQWDGYNWEWRGIDKYDGQALLSNKTIETYPSKDITVRTNDNGPQVELDGFTGTANFTFIFNDETHILTVDYAKPMAVLTASATEWDVDSKEPLVLRGYAKNATAACTYQFAYSTDGGTNWTDIGTASNDNVIEVTKEDLATVPNKLGTYQFKVVVTTTHKGETIQPEATKDVYLYKYYWLALKDEDNWANHIHVWKNGGAVKTEYPGDALTVKEGNWHFYQFQYPTYDRLIWNGTGDNKSVEITFDPNKLCHEKGSNNWNINTNATCPYRIYREFLANNYTISLDGTLTLTPTIRYYGSDELTYTWTIENGSDKVVLSSTNTPQTIVNPTAIGEATVKFVVSDGNESHEYLIYIHIIDGITIRVFNTYGPEFCSENWWLPYIHVWADGVAGSDHQMTNEGNGWYSYTTNLNPVNFLVKRDGNTGQSAEMTRNVMNVTESGCWKVSTYQWEDGDDKYKHLIDKTEDCGLYFRVHETLADGKTTYHSNKVTKVGQDLSFYAAEDGTLTLQHFDEAANKYVDIKTLTNPEESYVQVAKFAGNGISNMEKYTGDYWLRTNAFGDWNEYIRDAQKFTEFTRNSRFKNEEYNYYFVHHFEKGTLVTGQVANRINDNLATYIKEDAFTNSDGTLPAEGVSNVRFGYCPETNYFKRAIINGSSSGTHFLEVYGDNSTYFNGGQNNSTLYRSTELTDANKIWRDETNNYSLKFTDMSDWVYQANVYATVDNLRNADTRAVIAAEYNGIWNYLLGYDDVKQRPTFAYDVLGSTSSKNITYAITLIYDFKTNRLMSAWTPTDMTVEESMEVDADVMFLRHENGNVAQIGIANETATVDNLNGVVFVLEVESEGDANTEKHYWVSTPFDVKVSDIFGLERFYDGVTGDAWGIQRYRGDLRAKTGWWAEGPDTWWEWMTKDDTIKAGEGYLISIDKSLFSWPSIEVDGEFKAIKRLYFPSVTSHLQMSRTKGESITQTYKNQPCPFTRDRRDLKDGNWKIIGANSYNNAIATGGEAQGDYNEDAETPAEGTKLPNFRYVHHDAPTVAGQSYTAELGYGPDVVYRAFYSYPVQYAGTITWQPFTTDDQKVQGIAPRRYVMENEVTNVILRLELQQNGKMMDQTFVQFNDAATTSYDLNLDLGKFGCGSKISEISTLDDNGVVYAGNSMPSGEYVIPVGANIKVAGTYTFAMPAGTEQMTVYLLDYETGDKIDLGLSNYTVTFSKKANLKDRFALMIDNRKLPTDTKVIDANGNELIKFIRNEQMYILRNGHLYNANGAELSK